MYNYKNNTYSDLDANLFTLRSYQSTGEHSLHLKEKGFNLCIQKGCENMEKTTSRTRSSQLN